MKIKAKSIVEKIDRAARKLQNAKENAVKAAPEILTQLMDSGTSLRSVARETDLSPTYLSKVLNREQPISVGAFRKLVDVYQANRRKSQPA